VDTQLLTSAPAGEQFLLLGAQLVEAIVERLRAPAAEEEGGAGDAPGHPPGEVERLRRLCRALARHNARVARALGACRCWGERPGCPECGGEGRPGFHPIDRGAFGAFVAPAMAAEPEPFLGCLHPNAATGPYRVP